MQLISVHLFYILLLYWIHWSVIVAFWWAIQGSPHTVSCHLKTVSFTSSFPVWLPFISSSCLIAVAKTFITMLNKRGESAYPCVLNLKGNYVAFAHWVWCWQWVCLPWPLLLRYVHSAPTLLRVFIINGCWILSNAFSASTDMVMWFCPPFYVIYYIFWFANIVPSLHPWHKSHLILIMVYDLFNVLLELVH